MMREVQNRVQNRRTYRNVSAANSATLAPPPGPCRFWKLVADEGQTCIGHYITKVLKGDVNFTFATAIRFAKALQMDFTPTLTPHVEES